LWKTQALPAHVHVVSVNPGFDVECSADIQTTHITHENPLATGTKRGIAVKSNVDVGWERSEPNE